MIAQPTPGIPYKGYSIVPWVHKWGYWTCKVYSPDGEFLKTLPRSGRYGTFCKMVEMAEAFVDEEENEV